MRSGRFAISNAFVKGCPATKLQDRIDMPRERDILLAWLRSDINTEQAAAALAIPADKVEARYRAYIVDKLPPIAGQLNVGIGTGATLKRDRWGVAHAEAATLADAYFALGFAMGQDRLWQLDYLRRRVRGRLSEIMGASQLASDRWMRTLGLATSAERAVEASSDEVLEVLHAMADGINAAARRAADNMPLEFEILHYAFEPWVAADSIALWKWRWWMLSGRIDLIALQEASKRHLPPDLLAAFLQVEAGEETIVAGAGPSGARGHDSGLGSNNWVVGPARSGSGFPLLASDPHNTLDHPSQWYEAQIRAPGIDAIGAFYLGTPGIYLGRTRGASWGLTNHLASGRDLYIEEVKDRSYRDADTWRALDIAIEQIAVRDAQAEQLRIARTVRGPLINEFITPVNSAGDPALSLRWVGAGPQSGFEAMLALLRANSHQQVLQALEQWPFPNLNFVFADRDGHIGYHAVGTVPRRRADWLGFRPADQPEHQWHGQWSFGQLPQQIDPECGWLATANNPPWAGNGDYVQLGHWADGYRFRRIRERLQGSTQLSIEQVAALQADILHPRAAALAAPAAKVLRRCQVEGAEELAEALAAWDGSYTLDEIAPTLFEAFWLFWRRRVASERFPERWIGAAAERSGSIAQQLLLGKHSGWFADKQVDRECEWAWREALSWLREALGDYGDNWRWGTVHTVRFPHPLAKLNPLLERLLSPGPFAATGGNGTVRAAGFSTTQPFVMTSGSTYRLVVDMSWESRALATTTGGSSGHPGSPHYADQAALWSADTYHPLEMDLSDEDLAGQLELLP
jgi:penicillin G amidase